MTNQRALLGWMMVCGPLLFGCDENPGGDNPVWPGRVNQVNPVGAGGGAGGTSAVPSLPEAPTDNRPAVKAATPPPAVSGGNLLVTHDGKLVVVADSDRDRLVVVDGWSKKLLGEVPLMPGDEPGRLVEDAAGRVHVALRRGGAVATLDLASLTIVDRSAVCAGPRGIAFDAAASNVIVACADGKLVTLPSAGGPASASVFIGPDLRDVIVNEAGLWVSTFKSATLLRVGADGAVAARFAVPQLTSIDGQDPKTQANFEPEVAWRSAARGGQILMLHQAAQLDEIELVSPPGLDTPAAASGIGGASGSGSPYGAGGPCGGVVRATFSLVDANGTVETTATLGGGTLAVDFDVASDGSVAVAYAGSNADATVQNSAGGGFAASGQMFAVYPPDKLSASLGDQLGTQPVATSHFSDCAPGIGDADVRQPIVAVRFNPTNQQEVFLLASNPSRLYSFNLNAGTASPLVVELGGADVADTGHSLFHSDAGQGIACASCHPEGGEDGHVWTFSGFGRRRTQSLSAGLAQTAPFHWDGTLADVSQVMDEVFVKRMGGAHESAERIESLQHWLFSLTTPPPLRAADDAAVQRGAVLFASAETACATCHAGSAFTNNLSVLVGTSADVALQVPSLLGIGHRAPFMHTGCAATLRDRFSPGCGGGEEHGHTAQLSDAQLDDLTLYLESL
jgi:mono/diheme cytochrome c family protein